MTVSEILALAKGTKLENVTGIFAKISPFRKTATGKIRQTALLQDNTGEINIVIWGGKLDKFLYGSLFNIKEAYVDEYNTKKRLTINSNEAVNLVQAKEGYTPKAEQSAPSGTKVTPPAQSAPPVQSAPAPVTAPVQVPPVVASAPQVTPAPVTPAPQVAPQATTGAIEPEEIPIAHTNRAECKTIMQECITDVTALMEGLGLTAENFVASVNTLFIERSKRIRKERY